MNLPRLQSGASIAIPLIRGVQIISGRPIHHQTKVWWFNGRLKEEFSKVREDICSISYLKKGSITKCYQTCGNPGCRCHRDKKYRHGPYWWWSTKEGGKTKSILVPEEMLFEVRDYIDNYRLLKSKAKKLEEISERIMKIRIKEYKIQKKKSG